MQMNKSLSIRYANSRLRKKKLEHFPVQIVIESASCSYAYRRINIVLTRVSSGK